MKSLDEFKKIFSEYKLPEFFYEDLELFVKFRDAYLEEKNTHNSVFMKEYFQNCHCDLKSFAADRIIPPHMLGELTELLREDL